MIWILLVLAAVIGVAVLVWDFRRKTAAREAASKKRFEEIFRARPAAAPAPAAPQAAAAAAVAVTEARVATPAIAAPSPGRFLGQSETLVYRLLKAGISDHEVFANATLASVLGAKSEQEARRLAQYRLDFVVCDKAMHVVAVVEMEAAGSLQAAAEQRFKADSLNAAGIRLVRVNAAALPRREEMRGLVCGQPVAGPGAKE
ncbi:MAG TPA: DUF2726 domain-containing protein [Pseudolabrys sp.]